MNKDQFPYFLLTLVTVLSSKCEGRVFYTHDQLAGYKWATVNGNLYVKDGDPPRYLHHPKDGENWKHNSWILNDKAPPQNVQLLPFITPVEQEIVEEVNVRRAKTLLGAYFDPDNPTAFNVLPPAAHMTKVEYDEDLAETTARYMKHGIYEHDEYDEFFPHHEIGENLRLVPKLEQFFSIPDFVKESFHSFFENELPYYRHFDPYSKKALQHLLDVTLRADVRNNSTLNEEEKERQLGGIQYGHAIAMILRNVHSVGCSLSKKSTYRDDVFEYIFACKFGGAIQTQGKHLYDMDVNLLHLLGLPQSVYDPPKF